MGSSERQWYWVNAQNFFTPTLARDIHILPITRKKFLCGEKSEEWKRGKKISSEQRDVFLRTVLNSIEYATYRQEKDRGFFVLCPFCTIIQDQQYSQQYFLFYYWNQIPVVAKQTIYRLGIWILSRVRNFHYITYFEKNLFLTSTDLIKGIRSTAVVHTNAKIRHTSLEIYRILTELSFRVRP